MLPIHAKEAQDSVYINKEVNKVRTLEAMFSEYVKGNKNIFLNNDPQSYTKQVFLELKKH